MSKADWIADLAAMACRNINTKMVVVCEKEGLGFRGKIEDMPIELMQKWATTPDGEMFMQEAVLEAEEVFAESGVNHGFGRRAKRGEKEK